MVTSNNAHVAAPSTLSFYSSILLPPPPARRRAQHGQLRTPKHGRERPGLVLARHELDHLLFAVCTVLRDGRSIQSGGDCRRHHQVLHHAGCGSPRHSIRILHDADAHPIPGLVLVHGVQVLGVDDQHSLWNSVRVPRLGTIGFLRDVPVDGIRFFLLHAENHGQQYSYRDSGDRSET
jgi:hypothetical protein